MMRPRHRLLMKILLVPVILGALHLGGILLLGHLRLMELLLSPGAHSPLGGLLLAVAFVVIRFCLLVLVPGWLAARLLLWFWRPRGANH